MVRRLLNIIGWDRDRLDWARLADRQDRRPRSVDPALRERAQTLHRHLSRFLQASDPWTLRNLGVPDDNLPSGTDWHWRPRLLRSRLHHPAIAAPESGHRLGEDAVLWHDCLHRALILRQSIRPQPGQVACHAMQIEVMGFSGSFLSLALDLPAEALGSLNPDRILQVDTVMDTERPITIYARINMVQGPNTASLLCRLGDPMAGQGTHRRAEFDLAYADLAHRPIERAWLDLILEQPRMNAIVLGDALISHRARAQV